MDRPGTPHACCAPGGGHSGEPPAPGEAPTERRSAPDTDTMATLPAGRFAMGSQDALAYPGDGEGPIHEVGLPAFRIDRFAVSNARFAAFVDATAYVTGAERWGWAFVFAGLLPDGFPPTRAVAAAPWWRQVHGADWRHPEGPQSGLDGRDDHPVVQVSHLDALAYCTWAGVRLPTEAEWEYAARGGLERKVFPWGDDLEPGGQHRMNVWQGEFPIHDTGADGFTGTAPVDAFAPNGHGLHNTTGNVWEWTADWFDPGYYARSETQAPAGPGQGERRTTRGGSHLCHASYCRRYRVAARGANAPDDATGNIGFRVAADL